ncbi:MAG: hypothetical protein IE931_03180 [Sphingobacteriales bacterium]|nr:hypothetical protein [Sphingobacteriales bacterium]
MKAEANINIFATAGFTFFSAKKVNKKTLPDSYRDNACFESFYFGFFSAAAIAKAE